MISFKVVLLFFYKLFRRTKDLNVQSSYYFPEIFSQFPSIIAVQTTRIGGNSEAPYNSFNLGKNTNDNVEHLHQNIEKLCSDLHLISDSIVRSHQVHGTAILNAEKGGMYDGYDAMITQQTNLLLTITTADCIPILVFDKGNRAVAAIHAGWRGLKDELLLKTVLEMQESFGTIADDCFVYAGPCISLDVFEVGDEVAHQFDQKFHQYNKTTGKIHLDLKNILKQQLIESGIPQSQFEIDKHCSFKEENLYFSHRRDKGVTGRMLTGIGIFP